MVPPCPLPRTSGPRLCPGPRLLRYLGPTKAYFFAALGSLWARFYRFWTNGAQIDPGWLKSDAQSSLALQVHPAPRPAHL